MARIRILILDVDGTLTDGKIYMGNTGEMIKAFDIKDGCGIHDLLPSAEIVPVIITGRKSQILENRCAELGITEIYQGIRDKVGKLEEILWGMHGSLAEVAYIGDDINDLKCMLKVKENGGVIGCPADAAKQVVEIADFVSGRNGGNGAVREFIEWIIENGV